MSEPGPVKLNAYRHNPNSARICVKEPLWTYLLVSQTIDPAPAAPLDLLTWKARLLAAQTRYLGLIGSAIQVDLLHVEGEVGERALLRVPREEASKFAAALGDWVGEVKGGGTVGFRLVKMSNFMMGVRETNEEELFR